MNRAKKSRTCFCRRVSAIENTSHCTLEDAAWAGPGASPLSNYRRIKGELQAGEIVTHFGFVAPGFSPAQPSKCRPEGRRYGKLSHYPFFLDKDRHEPYKGLEAVLTQRLGGRSLSGP